MCLSRVPLNLLLHNKLIDIMYTTCIVMTIIIIIIIIAVSCDVFPISNCSFYNCLSLYIVICLYSIIMAHIVYYCFFVY